MTIRYRRVCFFDGNGSSWLSIRRSGEGQGQFSSPCPGATVDIGSRYAARQSPMALLHEIIKREKGAIQSRKCTRSLFRTT